MTRIPLKPTGSDATSGSGTTAVIYVRVSTKEQAERNGDPEGYSIPAQREACNRKAEAMGAVVLDEFVDRGESARSADRPQLQAMLQFVVDNAVTYVIVHKIDRLARNRADDVAINLALQQAGVQLVSVTENIDETPSGILLHGIMSSIAEFYSRNLANEVIKGSVQKAKGGGTPGRAPTGYINARVIENGQERRTIHVDPERGPHIAWAYEAYATGKWTIRGIQAELEERGLTSRPGPTRTGKPLARANVHVMLRNPYYMGIVQYRGVIYQGNHQPLVDPETWQKVQDLLTANNHAGEKQREHPHYLKGSVYCGTCGSRLIVSHAKNRHGTTYPYFICLGRQQRRTTCTQQAIRIEHAEDAVVAHYTNVHLTPLQAAEVRNYVLEEIVKLRGHADKERGFQTRRLNKLRDERKKLLDAHYADAIPLELLKTEQARIGNEIRAAETRLDAVDNDFNTAEINLSRALALVQDCETAYANAPDKLRRQFNQAFFKRLLIDDNYNVTSELAEPFHTLLSEDLRHAAAHKNHDQLTQAIEKATAHRDDPDDPNDPGDSNSTAPSPTMREVGGLKESVLVGVTRLELVTPAV